MPGRFLSWLMIGGWMAGAGSLVASASEIDPLARAIDSGLAEIQDQHGQTGFRFLVSIDESNGTQVRVIISDVFGEEGQVETDLARQVVTYLCDVLSMESIGALDLSGHSKLDTNLLGMGLVRSSNVVRSLEDFFRKNDCLPAGVRLTTRALGPRRSIINLGFGSVDTLLISDRVELVLVPRLTDFVGGSPSATSDRLPDDGEGRASGLVLGEISPDRQDSDTEEVMSGIESVQDSFHVDVDVKSALELGSSTLVGAVPDADWMTASSTSLDVMSENDWRDDDAGESEQYLDPLDPILVPVVIGFTDADEVVVRESSAVVSGEIQENVGIARVASESDDVASEPLAFSRGNVPVTESSYRITRELPEHVRAVDDDLGLVHLYRTMGFQVHRYAMRIARIPFGDYSEYIQAVLAAGLEQDFLMYSVDDELDVIFVYYKFFNFRREVEDFVSSLPLRVRRDGPFADQLDRK